MRLLLVEDDLALADQLQAQLRERHFALDWAREGREGLYFATEYDYDLAIVDLGLPELDGMTLIRRLREAGRRFPVLVLTARNTWKDKVEGLEAGADDYLTKPFHLEELVARIRALVRRAAGHADPVLCFGPLEVDTAARQVRRDGLPLSLTAYEYATLEYLVHQAQRVVSKTELTEHLYDQDFDRDSNVIEVFVNRLRRKLDPQGCLRPIATERGQGYRWALAVDTRG